MEMLVSILIALVVVTCYGLWEMKEFGDHLTRAFYPPGEDCPTPQYCKNFGCAKECQSNC